MKSLGNPRFVEPLAAALMGAGFFIFVSALLGGPFWQSLDEFCWSQLKGRTSVAPAAGVWVEGESGLSDLDVAQRRLALAHALDQMSAAGAKLIVLEAWLDEPSQVESEEVLADLLDSSQGLPKKALKSLRSKVLDIKTKLNADETLADSISKAANVILPVAVESDAQALTLSGAVWEKLGSYEVSRKGKGQQHLTRSWHVVRAPTETFRDAAKGLALLAGGFSASSEAPLQVPGIFELHGQWANGLGFDAAREALDVPAKGQHFIWRQGQLRAVELRGAEFPMSNAGDFWLPRLDVRERWQPWVLQDVDTPGALASLKGKVVFFQPWPALLLQAQEFQDQRDLCAGMLSQAMALAPENASGYWILLGAWILLLGLWGLGRLWLSLSFSLLAALGIFWSFWANQELLALPLGLWVSALCCGLGLYLILQKMREEERRVWLRGHVAPKAQKRWQSLVPDPTQGSLVEGVYLALGTEAPLRLRQLEAWASRWRLFCEALDEQRAGFFFAQGGNEPYPLAAIQELQSLLPGSKMASIAGPLGLSAERALDSVRWSLVGRAKEEALTLLGQARIGQYFITENDYSFIRQNVKIQVMAERELAPESGLKRVFNILEISLNLK